MAKKWYCVYEDEYERYLVGAYSNMAEEALRQHCAGPGYKEPFQAEDGYEDTFPHVTMILAIGGQDYQIWSDGVKKPVKPKEE